ncbi:four helix bundle protein [Roseivirga pacifica]|uniref:four helix bundle protein n=1 Tax=Roseivirga pacifica TaxID=1267423 RepID=UPI0020960FC4|nr:four helix bundle protein [Roseivirga pacifica]MCO6357369.1 four helix bundle protein [Roseivirga pacifica]MCO6367917.1 four helix bundle protein [Roseivirga pacifica]MCO6369601.1 four helix bundle protein [Roseivirga pacifica]MCO6373455.1 four helix bundle protein [Roseivirga pacifica]MCO6377288.1 four helix bundle protein [Roseivirga pacifica]
MNVRSFMDLDCWKVARVFRKDISLLAKTFPTEEKFGLVSQIKRSSRSVTANIAEGYGRYHHQENIQFCRVSRGSLTETLDHLTVALDEEYISETQFEQYKNDLERCLKVLNGYINYLVKTKSDK